ncbi:YncE family protein [Thermoleophilia bacterium SCSIO 60948]|nr:YncE family protein [Thermoleophilia bacterium SCSIO 60948]
MLKGFRGRLLAGGLSTFVVAAACVGLIEGGGSAADPEAAEAAEKRGSKLRKVVAVSNNWDGTIDLVAPGSLKRLKRINTAPDYDERVQEIALTPGGLLLFLAIRQAIGEGNDQLADDAFTSNDGRTIYVSRPSLADVVAIDVETNDIVWQVEMDGSRSDHMAISENGRELLVSDSTERQVIVINTRTGERKGTFPSGDTPHESNYSKDGETIYHASIGTVYTPLDQPELDTSKGERIVEIVDADTKKVLKTYDMGEELEKAGYPDMSSAVRPMTLSPNERFVYFQVSFFHGFAEFDLKREKIRRVVKLPLSKEAKETPKEDYLLDSAHHGIAMNDRGTKLCVAGTMSDYAAIVDRKTMKPKITRFDQFGDGAKPYWSTPSANGRFCYVSLSGLDRVAVISYRTGELVRTFKVGDHPQRIRTGTVRRSALR